MSDPQTNPDIEDVLSSIRRLVSEHAKPQQAPRAPAPEDDSGRLVLTPALRVAEPEEGPAPAGTRTGQDDAADWPDAVDWPDAPEAGAHDGDADRVEPGTHAADQSDEVRDDAHDPGAGMPEADDRPEIEAAAEETLTPESGAEDGDDPETAEDVEAEDASWMYDDTGEADEAPAETAAAEAEAEVEAEAERLPPSLEATIAELEAVINRSGERWEPEADEAALEQTEAMPWEDWTGDETGAAESETPSWRDDTDTHAAKTAAESPTEDETAAAEIGDDLEHETHDAHGADAAKDAEDAEDAAETMTAEMGAPDEAPDHDDLSEEADPAEAEPATATAHVHRLHGRPENIGYPDEEDELPPVSSEAFDLFSDEEAVLDEEMLRDLVAEIVRQELQGALGERITRNVRKLVRREIHRALASQELE